MHVLVTGGAGYIGSTTAAALLAAGHEVTVLDSLRSGHRDAVPDGAAFVEGDVRDRSALDRALAGDVGACVHFAALIEAGVSVTEPATFFDVNTGGSAALLRALVEHGVGRFVLSSTAAVYGDPRSTPIAEDADLAPTSPYGESKLLVERMLPWVGAAHGVRTAALRYFNAAGATETHGERHDPESHLIPIVLEVAEGRRPSVAINGTDYPTPDGTAVRDFVHVADLASAHVLALEALGSHEHLVCNLGNGQGHSVRAVIEAARRVTGEPIPAIERDRRPGDPAVLVASSARARELLGWEPAHPDLDDIVASAWRFRRAGR